MANQTAKKAIRSIEFDHAEIEAATAWHGGQGSMLYAVASTGALRCGTIRPHSWEHDRPMTDAEWFVDLASRLESEAGDAADAAAQAEIDYDDTEDATDTIDALRSIARRASEVQS